MKPLHDRHWYLLSYDISDDKRRSKVAKCLEGYGERLQYSVFRSYLSPRSLARLRWELSRKMVPEDGLLVIHLCPSCQAAIQDQRGKRDWRTEVPTGFKITGNPIKHLSPETPEPDKPPEKSTTPRPKAKPRSMKLPKP